jgi:hypothetical protein
MFPAGSVVPGKRVCALLCSVIAALSPLFAAGESAGSSAFTDVPSVAAYLANAPGGTAPGDPVPVEVAIVWPDSRADLMAAIAAAGKYVELDMSGCVINAVFYGIFDPDYTQATGKDLVVSLILPLDAISVAAKDRSRPNYFTSLMHVFGDAIETVGAYAFSSSEALTTVSFPAAVSIGNNTFFGCRSLTTVSLASAASIGGEAFADCDALASVSLPLVAGIGEYAFYDCDSLTTASLASAASIGERAFSDCDVLTKLYLSVSPPSLGSNVFSDINDSAMITIYVPSIAVREYKTWASDNQSKFGGMNIMIDE